MGSAAGSTALLGCIISVRSLREAWFRGRVFLIIALSAPTSWLRWGIVMMQATLLSTFFLTEPLAVKVVACTLVSIQLGLIASLPISGLTRRPKYPQPPKSGFFATDQETPQQELEPIDYSWNFFDPPGRRVFPRPT